MGCVSITLLWSCDFKDSPQVIIWLWWGFDSFGLCFLRDLFIYFWVTLGGAQWLFWCSVKVAVNLSEKQHTDASAETSCECVPMQMKASCIMLRAAIVTVCRAPLRPKSQEDWSRLVGVDLVLAFSVVIVLCILWLHVFKTTWSSLILQFMEFD